MPGLVALAVNHRRMVERQEIPVLAEVGHDRDVPGVPVVSRVSDHRFERAELAAERDLRVVVESLTAEDQDLVLVERVPNRAEVSARQRRRQVDAGHLADEERMQAFDGEAGFERSHGSSGGFIVH